VGGVEGGLFSVVVVVFQLPPLFHEPRKQQWFQSGGHGRLASIGGVAMSLRTGCCSVDGARCEEDWGGEGGGGLGHNLLLGSVTAAQQQREEPLSTRSQDVWHRQGWVNWVSGAVCVLVTNFCGAAWKAQPVHPARSTSDGGGHARGWQAAVGSLVEPAAALQDDDELTKFPRANKSHMAEKRCGARWLLLPDTTRASGLGSFSALRFI
jgi:hypothetical protein